MQQNEPLSHLGTEAIPRLLLRFSGPCILSLLVSALYNIVDQIFIGNSELGFLGNAATGIVFPLTMLSLAVAWCLGDGCAAYLSLCQGRGDTESAPRCVGSVLALGAIASLLLVAVFALWREPLLRLFGASDASLALASEYLTILLYAMPFFVLMNILNAVIRSDGAPAFSMLAISVGAVINLILDPIFIFVLHLGIAGAAYATVLGQLASFVISLCYLRRSKTFHLRLRHLLPDFAVLGQTLRLGISTFITQLSIVLITLVSNRMLFAYGTLSVYGPDIPISVISIETKVFTIVINIVVGIILGAQPILGYNYGAGRFDRVRETFRIALWSVLGVGLLATLLFQLAPQAVLGLFGTGSPLYLDFGVKTFRIFLSLISFTCVIKMSSIFFQSVGDPMKATLLSLLRDIACFIPLALILPRFCGIDGVLWAAPIADLLAMGLSVALLRSFFKKLRREEAEAAALGA